MLTLLFGVKLDADLLVTPPIVYMGIDTGVYTPIRLPPIIVVMGID